ncbi:hypothetical protein [Mucilaginibacter glaciei]|uniref:Uncharacterized protein n=1 Tax=Mucilaginibacter glaciei TaxID=2772109 RepID=A0A926S3D6_9SPHI|nr:hypothetical protein [Mucilaginibacter glaciei]MBD1395108.1 hypothetical protein [Mucilaginibacter glaciei]
MKNSHSIVPQVIRNLIALLSVFKKIKSENIRHDFFVYKDKAILFKTEDAMIISQRKSKCLPAGKAG